MVNFTFKGHKISIRNDDWRKLKERFNPDNAQKVGSFYRIRIPCPFCERLEASCSFCPVSITNTGISCLKLVESFFKKTEFVAGTKSIAWDKDDNQCTRRQLKAILRRMEKIEVNQKEG